MRKTAVVGRVVPMFDGYSVIQPTSAPKNPLVSLMVRGKLRSADREKLREALGHMTDDEIQQLLTQCEDELDRRQIVVRHVGPRIERTEPFRELDPKRFLHLRH